MYGRSTRVLHYGLSPLFLLLLLLHAHGFQPEYFERIQIPKQTAAGAYNHYTVSSIRCALLCSINERCKIWSWDSATDDCRVYTEFQGSTTTRSPTRSTYIRPLLGPYLAFIWPPLNGCTWDEAKDNCNLYNMTLAYIDDTAERKRLTKILGSFFLGLSKSRNDDEWHDEMDNLVHNPKWREGYPIPRRQCAIYTQHGLENAYCRAKHIAFVLCT